MALRTPDENGVSFIKAFGTQLQHPGVEKMRWLKLSQCRAAICATAANFH
jgi:hypothetical protein